MSAGLNGQGRRRSNRASKNPGAKQADDAKPTSFLSLPTEITTQIISLLDRGSAFELALTARRFTPIAVAKIWRDLDLTATTPPWGQQMTPPFSLGTRKLHPTSMTDGNGLDNEVKKRLQGALLGGTRARWAKVETLRCLTRPGSTHGLLQLLELASSSLKQLRMDPGDRNPEDEEDDGLATIDVMSTNCDFHFPNLTHVRIASGSIQTAAFLLHLCRAAPALVSLDASLEDIVTPDWLENEVFYRLEGDTQIRQLRIAFGSRAIALIEEYGCDDQEIIDHPILSLIRHSPLTQQFSVNYIDGSPHGACMFDYLMVAMKEWKDLRDVQWLAWHGKLSDDGSGNCPDDAQKFESVQRCILRPAELVNLFENLPSGPNLEIAYFLAPVRLSPSPYPTRSLIPPASLANLTKAQHLTSHFASQVGASPRFRHISYDLNIDANGGFEMFDKLREVQQGGLMGFIDSYIDGQEEVIRVRLLLDVVEVWDEGEEDPSGPLTSTRATSFEYYAEDGLDWRTRTFEPLPSAVWQTFTYYKSYVVPLEILEEMRGVEGLEKAEWEQRGVVVRDETWTVLTDWFEWMVASGAVGGP